MKKMKRKITVELNVCRSIAEIFDLSQSFNGKQIRNCREIKTKPSISP